MKAMRYHILLLALLLYNIGHNCLATRIFFPQLTKENTPATERSQTETGKTPAVQADMIIQGGDDGGGGSDRTHNTSMNNKNNNNNNSSSSSSSSNRNENYQASIVRVYQGKIGGKQPPNNEHKHLTQSATSNSTYATTTTKSTATSTTTTATSSRTTQTGNKTRTETPFSTSTASFNNEPKGSLSEAVVHSALPYKVIISGHAEKNAPNTATTSNKDFNNSVSPVDGNSSNKIIGSSTAPAALNIHEPKYTEKHRSDQLSQVETSGDLLNSDRYEFYTFDDNGDLIKRLMTMEEIESIVSNSDGEDYPIIQTPALNTQNDKSNMVQTLLKTNFDFKTNEKKFPNMHASNLPPLWPMVLPLRFENSDHKPIKEPESSTTTKSKPPKMEQTRKTEKNTQVLNDDRETQKSKQTNVYSTLVSHVLGEELAKHTHGLRHRIPPHRQKLPNDAAVVHATKRPQATQNKQKYKKKPTTTTTTTTSTPATTTTTTTEETTTTTTEETTTTTTEEPTTIPPTLPPDTTFTPTPPVSTIHKKKKKKPTRRPVVHPTHATFGNGHHIAANHTKPHPHGEKRKPFPQRPKPTHFSFHGHNYQHNFDQHQPIENATPPIFLNKTGSHKHQRPHNTKSTTTTTTTTSTTEAPLTPPTTASVIVNPIGEGIIAEEFPGIQIESYVSPNLLSQIKSEVTITTITTQPLAYPVPVYDSTKPKSPIDDSASKVQHSEKLPSQSMMHKRKEQEMTTEQPITPIPKDDINALMSFDQLMQILRNEANKKGNDVLGSEIKDMGTTKTTIFPPKYEITKDSDGQAGTSNKYMQNASGISRLPDTSGSLVQKLQNIVTPQNSMNEPQEDKRAEGSGDSSVASNAGTDFRKTAETTTMQIEGATGPQKAEVIVTSQSSNTEDLQIETSYHTERPSSLNTNVDQAHVLKFEPLYAEDLDPIITEITTEQPIETTTELTGDTTYAELLEKLENKTESDESKTTTEVLLRLPVSLPQKVENLIAEEDKFTESPLGIADLRPNLNMEVLKPSQQIMMSNFQTQAATVASSIVDGTSPASAESYMMKDELHLLMSDVLEQVANENLYKSAPPEVSVDRLSNLAPSSPMLKMKPVREETHSYTSEGINNKNDNNRLRGVTANVEDFTDEISSINPVEPDANKCHSTTEMLSTMDITTLMQSRHEPNSTEGNYLGREKQKEDFFSTEPAILETQSTSSNIPILSLSQDYSQQLRDDVDLKSEEQPENYPMANKLGSLGLKDNKQVIGKNEETNETMHLENQYEQFHLDEIDKEENPVQPTETTTSNEENPESDILGYVTTTMANNNNPKLQEKENINDTGKQHKDPDQEITTELPDYETTLKDSTFGSGESIEKEPFEKVYETKVSAQLSPADNKQNVQKTVTPSNEYHTSADIGNKGPIKSQTNSPVENLQLSAEKDFTPISPIDDGLSTYDETNTETSEEMLDELIASLFNHTGLEKAPEEAYVKLGESTARPTEHKLDVAAEKIETPSIQQSKNNSKVNIVQLSEPGSEPTQKKQMISYMNELEIQLPESGSQEQSDMEDDKDQAEYEDPETVTASTSSTTTTPKSLFSSTKRLNTLKPVSYYKQPNLGAFNQADPPRFYAHSGSIMQQRPMQRPPALSNLMASTTQSTRPPVKLEPSPHFSKGLEASVANLEDDVLAFAKFCNELAFNYWKTITSEKISSARSLVISPFALTSMLSMMFLGARGGTSGEMNEVLKLDEVVTFNPHVVLKNITDSVEKSMDRDIATAAFVREVFSDRNNGKILQFFKDKTQQLYAGHVEEVNFNVVNDIIRRRTNLLIKRHTMGKVAEYLRTNSVWVNGPLATISANLFQTDCSRASTHDRDGEMFFQVHPTVRQRRLVPIPAVLFKSGFTAGYEPKLDATVAAFGRIEDTVSVIYVMPGHQSSISPTDNLERLQKDLVELAFKENAWSDILTSVMDRPAMEVQLPRFSHRSFVNASLGLQKMGLKGLFKSDYANLRGLTGTSSRDIYLSDMIQINTFSTCGEERISDHHHVEMYPAPPLRKRNKDVEARGDDEFDSSEDVIDFGSLVQDAAVGRGFYDDLLDPKYLELPLPLRPRQARVPDTPRLRFDKPFLFFVRHNPSGMILFMGRFNPRLLP